MCYIDYVEPGFMPGFFITFNPEEFFVIHIRTN